jgi:hypothetical protein
MTQQTPLTNEELWILVLHYEHLIQLLLEQINDKRTHVDGADPS